jgi:hypothetical protein
MLAVRNFALIVREGRVGAHARKEIADGSEHSGTFRDRREISTDLESVPAERLLRVGLTTVQRTCGCIVSDEHEIGMLRASGDDVRTGVIEHHVKSRAPVRRVADLLFDDESSAFRKGRDERRCTSDRVERDDPLIRKEGSHLSGS